MPKASGQATFTQYDDAQNMCTVIRLDGIVKGAQFGALLTVPYGEPLSVKLGELNYVYDAEVAAYFNANVDGEAPEARAGRHVPTVWAGH